MPEDNVSYAPKDNPYVIGHTEAEKLFLQCWQNNSLHNSWLISGIEGIGKATLAYKFARFLLSADSRRRSEYSNIETPLSHPVFKLVSSCAHPDFKAIERDYTDTDRRKILKAIKDGAQMGADELKDLKKSAFIRVDDVRTINDFLSRRSSGDGWRVVLIDSVDDMNPAAANALLKILEEPPHQTLLMLISHNPNRLLATIKSRCAKLELKPLDDNSVASLLRRYRPQLGEGEIKKIAAISAGSIGKALSYSDNNALGRYDELCRLCGSGTEFTIADLLSFCTSAAAGEDSYYLTQELLLKYLSEKIRNSQKINETAACWSNAVKTFNEVEGLNLDKKQALINIIANICKNT